MIPSLTQAATIQPFINGIILVAILAYIVIGSRRWTGPSQAALLQAHENRLAHLERRIGQYESSYRLQYEAMTDSLDAMRLEIRTMSANVARIGEVTNVLEQLRVGGQDLEQMMQAFVDLGCGAEGCPRVKRVG